MKRIFMIVLLSSLTLGCTFNAPQGPLFEPYSINTKDKALIYVYRPLGESTGYDRTYYLLNHKGKVTDLKHGGYFPFEVEAGKISLLADVNDTGLTALSSGAIELLLRDNALLEFEAKEGEKYFVRFKPIAHFIHFEPTLSLVTENEGMKEISECKLIGKNK